MSFASADDCRNAAKQVVRESGHQTFILIEKAKSKDFYGRITGKINQETTKILLPDKINVAKEIYYGEANYYGKFIANEVDDL